MMRIHGCGRITGEMFATTENALFAHPLIERARQPLDLFDIFAIAAAAQRVVRLVIEGNVEHRAKIEVESEETQKAACDISVPPDESNVVPVPQLLGVWRLVAN